MVEVDAELIESVQSLCDQKSDQGKKRFTSSDELEREKEVEGLLKDLANYKVLLEAKESAYEQALLKLDHCQKTADELSTLLKNSEFEKDTYANECRENRIRLHELESKMTRMFYQLSESVRMREQLSRSLSKLKTTQAELLRIETDLTAAREAKLEALAQVELRETELQIENGKTKELLRHVSELNEGIQHLKLAATGGEREICAILSEKEAELELATKTEVEAQVQLEYMRQQLEAMQNLVNQLMDKSVFIDSLKLELQQANELHSSSEKAASDAISELNQLKSDFELQERKISDQLGYIELLEMELNQLRLELEDAKEEVHCLNSEAKWMTSELEKVKNEMEELRGRETEAQVEIAMLKSALHEGASRVKAAKAAEARAKSEIKEEEAEKENQGKAAEESENFVIVEPQYDDSSQDIQLPQIAESEPEGEDGRGDTNACIKISKEEYEALIKKAEKADQVTEPVPENKYELENLKKELEIATTKTGEFRNRAEQAVSRAEAAEKAKAMLEDRIRTRRERRERRKAALAALRELESFPEESTSFAYEQSPETRQPLARVLNIKFKSQSPEVSEIM